MAAKDYDENGTVTWWWEHEYNENGVCIHTVERRSNGKIKSEFYYDDNGEKTCYRSTDEETGAYNQWVLYIRNEKGYLIREEYYDENGYLDWWFEYVLDENGNELSYDIHHVDELL